LQRISYQYFCVARYADLLSREANFLTPREEALTFIRVEAPKRQSYLRCAGTHDINDEIALVSAAVRRYAKHKTPAVSPKPENRVRILRACQRRSAGE